MQERNPCKPADVPSEAAAVQGRGNLAPLDICIYRLVPQNCNVLWGPSGASFLPSGVGLQEMSAAE